MVADRLRPAPGAPPCLHVLQVDYNKPAGFDRARNREIGKKDITLKTMEEAFTSEHWIVRIFKVSPRRTVWVMVRERLRLRLCLLAPGGLVEPATREIRRPQDGWPLVRPFLAKTPPEVGTARKYSTCACRQYDFSSTVANVDVAETCSVRMFSSNSFLIECLAEVFEHLLPALETVCDLAPIASCSRTDSALDLVSHTLSPSPSHAPHANYALDVFCSRYSLVR